MVDLLFLAAAALCVISACAIVTCKNPVYSVIGMLPFFLGIAGLFVLLEATFLAAMQIMVYGGAILVVFLFVIMLIHLRPEDIRDDFSFGRYLGLAALAGVTGGVILSFVRAGVPPDGELERAFAMGIGSREGQEAVSGGVLFGSAESIGLTLFRQYVIPLELVGVLLMVAILGAVILSKKKL
ncbi:MAG: NADH dehydrogenase [Planctomycetota bacterium]